MSILSTPDILNTPSAQVVFPLLWYVVTTISAGCVIMGIICCIALYPCLRHPKKLVVPPEAPKIPFQA